MKAAVWTRFVCVSLFSFFFFVVSVLSANHFREGWGGRHHIGSLLIRIRLHSFVCLFVVVVFHRLRLHLPPLRLSGSEFFCTDRLDRRWTASSVAGPSGRLLEELTSEHGDEFHSSENPTKDSSSGPLFVSPPTSVSRATCQIVGRNCCWWWSKKKINSTSVTGSSCRDWPKRSNRMKPSPVVQKPVKKTGNNRHYTETSKEARSNRRWESTRTTHKSVNLGWNGYNEDNIDNKVHWL